ncbi:MAG TPA: epoxyqueuosine reductase QueH [Negativicutes bacterium]|nr:epoxyqueuosine reductase QueH [Negativicutes bacterium]
MKVLLHMCCGPCSIAPVKYLRAHNLDIEGYFYNPNIHPYKEFERRLDTLREYAAAEELPLTADDDYALENFLRGVVNKESARCPYCYEIRLRAAARKAKECGADAFSTTLLVSPYQNHAQIKAIGETVAREEGIPFYYADYRPGWQEAVSESRRRAMYRQPYCGCIYSEKDRYYKPRKEKS